MPEVWSNLSKSQDDPQTIAEAITAAISAHEAEPTSHMGTGESIDMHRKSDVIDHLAGSVRGDKFPFNEAIYNFLFESFDNYSVSVGGLYHSIGGLHFQTDATSGNRKHIYAYGQYARNYFDTDKESVLQFQARSQASSNKEAYLMLGGDGVVSDPPGFGFKFVGDSLYAVEAVWGVSGYEEYLTEILGVTTSDTHVYRVHNFPPDNKCYFYVDGVEVASMVPHTNDDVGLILFTFAVKTLENGAHGLEVSNVFYSVQIQ